MKKLKTLQIINILLLCALVLTLLVIKFCFTEIRFDKCWYIIVVAFYSIILFVKFFLLKSDNMLWFAIVLMLLTIYMTLFNLGIVDMSSSPVINLFFAFSSLVIFLMYRSTLHLCLIVLFVITGMPAFLLSYKIVGFWWFVLIEVVANILAIVIINFIYYNYKR